MIARIPPYMREGDQGPELTRAAKWQAAVAITALVLAYGMAVFAIVLGVVRMFLE